MRKPVSVDELDRLGRVRLSASFFMRDMLHSEIAQMHGLLNAPDDPELAIAAGTHLCEELLEPLQARWGVMRIRSAYRSAEVNALGHARREAGETGYNCNSNAFNAAGHIWDLRDAGGHMGATACVVLPQFWNDHQAEGDWQILARWIDEELNYSRVWFYPQLWAFNIQWHEAPERRIDSYAEPKGQWRG